MRKKRTKTKTTKNRSAERSNEIFNRGRDRKFLARLTQFNVCVSGNQKAILIASIAMNQAVRLNVLNCPPVNAIKAIKENIKATMKEMDDRKNVASCETVGIF